MESRNESNSSLRNKHKLLPGVVGLVFLFAGCAEQSDKAPEDLDAQCRAGAVDFANHTLNNYGLASKRSPKVMECALANPAIIDGALRITRFVAQVPVSVENCEITVKVSADNSSPAISSTAVNGKLIGNPVTEGAQHPGPALDKKELLIWFALHSD